MPVNVLCKADHEDLVHTVAALRQVYSKAVEAAPSVLNQPVVL